MATISAEALLETDVDTAWAALSDFGAAGELFAGVLVDCERDGNQRTVTFANGMVVTEQLVTIDHEQRRFVYSVMGDPFTQHSASMQIVPDGDGSRFVWVSDFLPDDVRAGVEPLVTAGCEALKTNLDGKRGGTT
jgi:Polyketide cyclase / dehydrase and lipid transport